MGLIRSRPRMRWFIGWTGRFCGAGARACVFLAALRFSFLGVDFSDLLYFGSTGLTSFFGLNVRRALKFLWWHLFRLIWVIRPFSPRDCETTHFLMSWGTAGASGAAATGTAAAGTGSAGEGAIGSTIGGSLAPSGSSGSDFSSLHIVVSIAYKYPYPCFLFLLGPGSGFL